MNKKFFLKVSLFMLMFMVSLGLISGTASASSVHITNFSGTTTPSTLSATKNYHHFYSTKDSIEVKFKVDAFVQTKSNKRVYVQLQKSNGFWWSTITTKSVTNTSQITFTASNGMGDYRLVVYDAAESTGWDKPPLYYAKSSKYSGSVSGY